MKSRTKKIQLIDEYSGVKEGVVLQKACMHSLELHDLIIDCCRPTIFKEEDELYSLMEVGDAVFILLIV